MKAALIILALLFSFSAEAYDSHVGKYCYPFWDESKQSSYISQQETHWKREMQAKQKNWGKYKDGKHKKNKWMRPSLKHPVCRAGDLVVAHGNDILRRCDFSEQVVSLGDEKGRVVCSYLGFSRQRR
ncbi:MAG: hypothetical protein R8M38_01555 [Mariprofundaceae bacterium]